VGRAALRLISARPIGRGDKPLAPQHYPLPDSAVGMSVASKANIDAWFERIGFAGSIAPSLETLGQLVQMHTLTIPFENLDPLMGAPVRLDMANLQQKLLFDKRGGYCLEHNLLIKAMLEELDYEVKVHPAVTLWGREEPVDEPASHIFLVVDIAGARYLVDGGFGRQSPTAPLRLRADVEQATPHEPYRLLEQDGTWRLEAKFGEDWRALYRFTLDEIDEEGLSRMNEEVSHSPQFRERLVVARAGKDRRLALLNSRLTIRPNNGESEVRDLTSVAELREVLTGMFGIQLPGTDRLDPALQRALDAGVPD
jgi:N-hydroxyarylamine O-acetyltransferase